MTSINSKEKAGSGSENIWIISRGKFVDMDLTEICNGTAPQAVMEYQISDLARYMLSLNPIKVEKRLVGCEIRYQKPLFYRMKEKILSKLAKKLCSPPKEDRNWREVLISPYPKNSPPLTDKALESHFNKIEETLRPYNSIVKRLSTLDVHLIADIIGICEDLGEERTLLNIEGTLDEKIDYMISHINGDVGVVLGSAYIADGLFEMRGFDFGSYDPGRSLRLIQFVQDGKSRGCVLGPDDAVLFWIEDMKLLRYMQLLEQSIQNNSELKDSFYQCTEGYSKPFRLFFNKQLEIDYSKSSPPEIYEEVFETCQLGDQEKYAVINSLNSLQMGISFNYIPQADSREQKLYTSLSVMHNVRALEPIKDKLPQLFSEINKRAAICGAGRFYLLDSVGGYQNAQ